MEGKSPGRSNVNAEMLKTSPGQCIRLIADLIKATVKEGKVLEERNSTYIVSFFEGECRALDRETHRSSAERVEIVIEKIIREYIVIDDMQFGFLPGRETTDAIFIVRQRQKDFLGEK